MMSTIFTTETKTKTRPRQDAKIRVEAFQPGSTEKAGYMTVDLLEFHPDYDNRLKFRSYALVRATPELRAQTAEHPHVFETQGEGYLEEPYISINEVFIHPQDLRELMDWCRAQLHLRKQYTPLIIHPQPRPFPMFKKNTRVVVLEYKDTYYDTAAAGQVGQLATIAEASSAGGLSTVVFDTPELNRGFKSIGIPSIALREVK